MVMMLRAASTTPATLEVLLDVDSGSSY
jgi:hypothetical protein